MRGGEDYLTFVNRDFKLALNDLHKNHLHSSDVIQACKNYASVIEMKRNGQTWWNAEYMFFDFVRLKSISRFLPDNFNIEDFKDNGKKTGSAISNSNEYKDVEIDF